MTTYSALIRAAAAQVLALRHEPTQDAAAALIGRLYSIADGLERGDPAELIAGDPTRFSAGDPPQFKAGDPSRFSAGDPAAFSHITFPDVVAVLQAGPDGDWTDQHTQAALRTFGAFEKDRDDRDNDVPNREEAALALHDAYLPDTGPRDRAKAWAALYRFWMDAAPPAAVQPAAYPYRAVFQGQAWISDHAVPVDDARHTFCVSQAEVDECWDRGNGVFDELSDAALAPGAVRNWPGPFDMSLSRRLYRIDSDHAGSIPLYADDAQGVRAILSALFAEDAALEGAEPDAALLARVAAFEGLTTPGESVAFEGLGMVQTVTAQDPLP